jgi:tricorn protease
MRGSNSGPLAVMDAAARGALAAATRGALAAAKLAALGIAALAVSLVAGSRGASGAEAALPDGFYRYPSIGGGSIVFASEGDLWAVPTSGGLARRLTAHEGREREDLPGRRLDRLHGPVRRQRRRLRHAGRRWGPARLTYHPSSDQGSRLDRRREDLLFRSRRDHPHGDYRIYTIDPAGGLPAMIPLEPAAWISFEPDDSPGASRSRPRRVAMEKIGLEFHTWKRYRGGEAEDIWVGTVSPPKLDEVTRYEGKDAFPMWAPDGRIYFVTDRWGRPNLASMQPDGSDVKRLTTFEDYDVRWPSMGDGKIVYQHKMDLWVYDLRSARNEIVPIRLPSDRLQVRERFVDPMGSLGEWSLSRDGERIALVTRGDLFVARTRKKGLIRRITENSSARTKMPCFSPDGKQIAAWSEVEGEEQLFLFSSDSSAPAKQLGRTPPGWHYGPLFSPDGSRLAWGDEKFKLMTASTAGGGAEVVDGSIGEITEYAWSPDSRYLAYTVELASELNQVRVWDGKEKKVHEITSPMINSFSPAWDPKGKFLYILSDRWISPARPLRNRHRR